MWNSANVNQYQCETVLCETVPKSNSADVKQAQCESVPIWNSANVEQG